MKPDRKREADRWLRQAENDLGASEALRDRGFYAQACFQAEQSVEKALKAINYFYEGREAWGHQVSGSSGLLQAVIVHDPSFGQYQEDASMLDQYYIPTRYPDALPDQAPYEVYSKSQAQEAIEKARGIISHARRVVEGIG